MKIKFLTGKEVTALHNSLQGRDRIVLSLGLYAGLRADEVFRLKWNDIDFAEGLLKINRKKQNKRVVIPMPRVLIAELETYKTNCTGDRLFDDQSTNCFIRYFKRLNRKLKLLISDDVTFMTLRHTYGNRLINAGIPVHAVSNLLGHTISTTVRKYACIGALEN